MRRCSPDIFEGDPVDAPCPPASFDVVTSFHVVEHLPRPVAALARMLDWPTPGGVLIVEVPNAAGIGSRVFGRYWSGLDFPRHLVHFTPATMAAMVERAGGRIVGVRHRSKPRWLIWSLRHWLAHRPGAPSRIALAALDRRAGAGATKLALELVTPLSRALRLGEMVQYSIQHR